MLEVVPVRAHDDVGGDHLARGEGHERAVRGGVDADDGTARAEHRAVLEGALGEDPAELRELGDRWFPPSSLRVWMCG